MGGDGIHAKTSSTSDPPVIIVNSRRLKFCTKKRANISQFMKNREILPKIIIKWLLILLLIISMVSPIFYYIYVEKTQSNPQEIIFVYDVVATTTSNKYRLGNYKIRYLPKENLVIEIKDYTIPIQTPNSSANVNVINTKTYHYSQDAKLEQYNEIETLDSRKKFEKNVSIDYDLPSGQIIVHFSENLSPTETFTLEDNLPYTINSSFVLSMGLRENPSFDSSWLCYEGQGYIDSYEYLGVESITAENSTNVMCKKIQQTGMFISTYWINGNGQLMRIEQQMAEDYTVSFILKYKEEIV